MDGIILIDKEKGITSRDLVNKVSKKLNTRHVGHAGTLDPLATGLMIIGVNKGTKILDLLTLDKKEYIATVKLGIETDTLDITGNVLKKENNFFIDEKTLTTALTSFQGKYLQEVPKYSAVKINGKKLYEYARKNIDIELPKRLVEIYNIKLLNFENSKFTFQVLVSKGTYIRSLIKDIGNYLNIPCTMTDLRRIKSGKFIIEDSFKVEDNFKIIPINKALDFKSIKITDEKILKKVKNGNKVSLDIDSNYVFFVDSNKLLLAIYQKEKKCEFKSFKVF